MSKAPATSFQSIYEKEARLVRHLVPSTPRPDIAYGFEVQLFEDGVEELGDGAIGGHGTVPAKAGHGGKCHYAILVKEDVWEYWQARIVAQSVLLWRERRV